jgi:hypothetical protein
MTLWRQLQANRRNALKSTGPRTEEGKHISRRNAFRHGLTAETVIDGLEGRASGPFHGEKLGSLKFESVFSQCFGEGLSMDSGRNPIKSTELATEAPTPPSLRAWKPHRRSPQRIRPLLGHGLLRSSRPSP